MQLIILTHYFQEWDFNICITKMKKFIYIILGILLMGCSSSQFLIHDDVYYRTEIIYYHVSPSGIYYYPPYRYIHYNNLRPVYVYPINRVITPKQPTVTQPRTPQGTTVPRSRPTPPPSGRRN
jgi:hypothetical protein